MKFNLILFLVLINQNIFSQKVNFDTAKIEYVKAYKNHSDNSNIKPKPLKNLNYTLLFDDTQSLFYQSKKMIIDDNYKNRRFAAKGGGQGIYYKNIKTKEKKNIIDQDGLTYSIIKKYNSWNWKIQNETKKVLGYTCIKAIGEMVQYNYVKKENITLKVVAWFTKELPFSFGPSGFDGLPGLVLESQRGSFYFIATKIDFDSNIEIKVPNDVVVIGDEEFAKMQYEAFINYVND